MDQLRPLFAQAGGVSPILHGSGIFYRGGTHVFSALTLGGPGDSQNRRLGSSPTTSRKSASCITTTSRHFGGRDRPLRRDESPHGRARAALAEKALSAVIPPKETFPYTIPPGLGSIFIERIDVDGLGLRIDARIDGRRRVPITAPVAGIAMGVIYETPSATRS